MFYPPNPLLNSSTGSEINLYAATADLSITGDFPLPNCPAKITYSNHTYTRIIPDPKTDRFHTDPIELSLTIVQSIPSPSFPYMTPSLSPAPSSASTTHRNHPTTQKKKNSEDSLDIWFTATADLRVTGDLPLPARPKNIFYNGHYYSQAFHGAKHDYFNLFLTIVGTGIPKGGCPVNPHLQTFNSTSSHSSSMLNTNVPPNHLSSTLPTNEGTAPTQPSLNKGDIKYIML